MLAVLGITNELTSFLSLMVSIYVYKLNCVYLNYPVLNILICKTEYYPHVEVLLLLDFGGKLQVNKKACVFNQVSFSHNTIPPSSIFSCPIIGKIAVQVFGVRAKW